MAARAGMSKICWEIAAKNRGECIRLATIFNKQNLRPYDLIRNEKGQKHRQIKEWLRMESLVNSLVINNNNGNGNDSSSIDKSDDQMIMGSMSGLNLLEKCMVGLKMSTRQQGYAEWALRYVSSFLVMVNTSFYISFR